jgi:hypothetical protein
LRNGASSRHVEAIREFGKAVTRVAERNASGQGIPAVLNRQLPGVRIHPLPTVGGRIDAESFFSLLRVNVLNRQRWDTATSCRS